MNLLEIAKAWKIAANPSEEEEQLANQRLLTCNTCPEKILAPVVNIFLCGKCFCPLEKKIYHPENTCPLHLWLH